MKSYFQEKFSHSDSAYLIDIVSNPTIYDPDAVAAAEEILKIREGEYLPGVDPDQPANSTEQAGSGKPASKKVADKRKASFRYIRAFWAFITRPDMHRIQTSINNRILLTIRFYFLTLLFLLISRIPTLLLQGFGLAVMAQQRDLIPDSLTRVDVLWVSLIIPIMAGFWEETQFRLVLGRFNKRYFDLFVACFLAFFIARLTDLRGMLFSDLYSGFLFQYFLLLWLLAAVFYFSLRRTNLHSRWFEANWNRAYKYLFYSLAIVFAVLHLPTLDINGQQLLFWPILILPFLVYSLVFSFVRVRIGFAYAIALHFTIDLVVVLMTNPHH